MKRSPYIAYFDESGDRGMDRPDPDFPVFVLCAAVFKIEDYLRHDAPLFSDIKFRLWYHDAVVFHSHKIRKRIGDFAALAKGDNGQTFMAAITEFFEASSVTIIAAAIHKVKHKAQYAYPEDPYCLSAQFCLERLYGHVREAGDDALTYCIFEERGPSEDLELADRFSEVCAGANQWHCALPFRAVFASKLANLPGLQVADLAAYPIARRVMDASKANQAWETVEKKLRTGPKGCLGWGLKIFPPES